MKEFRILGEEPEIKSVTETLSELSSLELQALRSKLESQSEQEREGVLHGSIAEIMDTQLQSNTIDRAYEAAIIQHDVDKAVQIIKATGWFKDEDVPETNPSFLTWIGDRARDITRATLEQLKVLRELEKYIRNYPLESIQAEFSYTPKLILQFKREISSR